MPAGSSTAPAVNYENAPVDSPEGNVGHSIRLFCESGSMSTGGEEVLHLPVIVESAESSPTAAAAAAHQIRKFLTREYSSKPHVQYNAVMLIRILCDNPGPSFTKNFDKSFVSTVKELLRNCKDGSTQQILRETLDQLEANKSLQDGMEAIITMWRKEKGNSARLSQGPQSQYYPMPQQGGYQQDGGRPHQHRSHSHRQLPPPAELASRIEEARNTAKILLQLIQSTPAEEVLGNDLLREFADRCQSAQRSMQGFINCNTPPPDDDTMLTLIETNEQLSLALSRHQRAQLTARRAAGLSPSPQHDNTGTMASGGNGNGPYQPPPLNPPSVGPPSDDLFAASPPPQQQQQRQYTPQESAFAQPPPSNESFVPPPGPPPGMLARLNSREGQQSPVSQYNSPTMHSPNSPRFSQQQQHSPSDAFAPPPGPPPSHQYQQPSDPFADPVEHDPNSAPAVSIRQTPTYIPNPAQRPHSQSFNIDSEPSYPVPSSPQRHTDRPALGAYHNSTITGSYLNRQDEASQGMTTHGGGVATGPSEIDGKLWGWEDRCG